MFGAERAGVPQQLARGAGGLPQSMGSRRVKEREQLVIGLHGTHWNPALPGLETMYNEIPKGL